ncbi:phosphoribosylformylglycinamidine synthase subunit II [Ligilactobacillus sp. WC1T17]|uniref:Phosphoribosylformylglycinamidine synthase subunit PurL n=1 Tax=Ligilactobacillus ruminis TaxID=1623 RepID=A0ABY1A9T7_9LACO|nr:phosphoribosylformylglycinamidine synthase subunit II [Ligilactobacillus ruminis]
MAEMTPEEIKAQKPYLDWSLTEHEYDYICDHLLHRLPNYTETGLFSVMWSEHCSYKKSKPVLKLFPNKNDRVLQGPGEGAGIIDIGDGQAVVFKAESHNHPSAVEPYEGAATGVGGILRDIFSMGARPIASLDSLHFGEIDRPRTKYLINEVVAGIGGYGNCMGIPTIAGEMTFDNCYTGNCLVNAMSVGLMEQKDMQKGRASGVGNAVIYVGAKTGRDGIHGATFASADFADDKATQRSAVQVGNPFMEKLLMEACLELTHDHHDWLVGIQDMGAAGIVSSSCEMASKADSGMELNLDMVPQREPGMSAYEIMLSESQERMLLCVKKGHEDDVIKLFKEYELEAVVIGRVTAGHQYVLYHHGEKVTDIPVSSLTDDVLEEPSAEQMPARIKTAKDANVPEISDVNQALKQILAQPTIASKQMFTQTYDSQVRTSTVVGPGSDAGVLRVRGTKKGLAMTTDGNGRFVYLDPKIGGKRAVAEACANMISSGALPLGMTDCLNYGDPNDPEIYWELHQSVSGMAQACEIFDTPVISGNVSLYNENNGEAIYGTPMVGMVGLIKDLKHVIPSFVQKAGSLVYLVGLPTEDDYAGSEIQKMLTKTISGRLHDFDLVKTNQMMKTLLNAMEQGLVESSHDLSEGGLGVALAETCFNTNLGLKLDLDLTKAQLFSETPGRFVVTVPKNKQAQFEKMLAQDAVLIGEVTADGCLEADLTDGHLQVDVLEAQKIWEEAIPCLMKSKD